MDLTIYSVWMRGYNHWKWLDSNSKKVTIEKVADKMKDQGFEVMITEQVLTLDIPKIEASNE